MIAYASQTSNGSISANINLPIFLQYVVESGNDIENMRLKPHGNAKKTNRPFTSTLPSVVAQIKVKRKQNRGICFFCLYVVNTSVH